MTQFNTKLVHGPQLQTDKAGAIVPPVYQSAMYRFAPDGGTSDWDYARSSNPTRDYLERQIATLENGDAGFAFPAGLQRLRRFSRFSRMAATLLSVIHYTAEQIGCSISILLNMA